MLFLNALDQWGYAMKTDVYQTVTDRIVAMLEKTEHGKWRAPWHGMRGKFNIPYSVANRRYSGVNVWLLLATKMEKGYASDVWGTFQMWKAKGASVMKDEKATEIVFWQPIKIKENSRISKTNWQGRNARQSKSIPPKAAQSTPAINIIFGVFSINAKSRSVGMTEDTSPMINQIFRGYANAHCPKIGKRGMNVMAQKIATVERRYERCGFAYTDRTRMMFAPRFTVTRKEEDKSLSDIVLCAARGHPEPTEADISECLAAG